MTYVRQGLAIAAGMAAGVLLVAAVGLGGGAGAVQRISLALFARPSFVPSPPDNPPSPVKAALGKRLFEDPALSVSGKIACASCHDPTLAYADGTRLSAGVTGRRLARHTSALWNLAWSPALYWDGRAGSFEDQARFPLEHTDEMGEHIDTLSQRLAGSPAYQAAFAQAFPEDPRVTPRNLLKAIATFERTLVSPPTRFDRWVAGEASALDAAEQRGFALFTGKAHCVACHSGWAFTDYAFHDIGLPGGDRGRGAVINLAVADHAFKTPSLRELAWTAPYMHDGSIDTLEKVVRHYEQGGIRRRSLSPDMPRPFRLSDSERNDLVAFLQTLSSEDPPQPSREPWVAAPAPPARPPEVVGVSAISQKDKLFRPAHIRIARGTPLTIFNDDTRTHNVRIFDPRFDYNSGAQEPGQSIRIEFPATGTFEASCGIHPTMRLTVDVTP